MYSIAGKQWQGINLHLVDWQFVSVPPKSSLTMIICVILWVEPTAYVTANIALIQSPLAIRGRKDCLVNEEVKYMYIPANFNCPSLLSNKANRTLTDTFSYTNCTVTI